MSRKIYRHADLVRTIAPKSIAVVGVSANAAAFGTRTYAQIVVKGGYRGPVHAINPKAERIGDIVCHPSIASLPETPDCVFIAIPRQAVEPVVRECADRGVGGVVIFSSGFSETGKADRRAEQQRLVELAAKGGVRIVGPNCIGISNHRIGMLGSFSPTPFGGLPRKGAIGIVSQSGALGNSLAEGLAHGTALSHVLTSGNACDVDAADQVAYLAEDPDCAGIACVFEGMSDPGRLIEAARLCAQNGKPLVVYKMAVGERGAKAAMSHTGSLAGSNAAYRAALEREGAVLVDDFERVVETTVFLVKAPAPKAGGIAVVATSGGACIMSLDKAEKHGVELPYPAPATMQVLERVVPEFGAPGNPCDVTAQVLSSAEALFECTDALMKDPTYAALVIPHVTASDAATPRIKVFGDAAARYGKIACNVWVSQHHEGPGVVETETNPNVAMFHSIDSCFSALASWQGRDAWQRALPRRYRRTAPADAAATAGRLIDAAPNRTLTERESKAVLAAYGVPVVGERLVDSAEDAARAAEDLGLPVALKVESPDLPHKTEAGVIRLNLKSAAEVRAAYAAVMANAAKVRPAPRINGVLVQPMIPSGTEIMVGARIDPQFGPLVVVGLGGILVELMKDSALELAPVTPDEARAMLRRLKGRALLEGFRGADPVDEPGLADLIVRLSEFADDQRNRIAELDVNPLICSGPRIVAVDALIVKAAAA